MTILSDNITQCAVGFCVWYDMMNQSFAGAGGSAQGRRSVHHHLPQPIAKDLDASPQGTHYRNCAINYFDLVVVVGH